MNFKPYEVTFIRKNYFHKTDEEIAQFLNIGRDIPVTKAMVNKFRQNHGWEKNMEKIAKPRTRYGPAGTRLGREKNK